MVENIKEKLNETYLKIPDISDMDMVKEYADEYKKLDPKYNKIDENNYLEKLKIYEEHRNGIGIDGAINIHVWLINNNKIIGHGTYNPELGNNKILKTVGGHISYEINPKYRNQGYGTIACHLLIKKCLESGLKEVMISCLETNEGSQKVIKNNSGIFKDMAKEDDEKYLRFTINTEESIHNFYEKYNIEDNHLSK